MQYNSAEKAYEGRCSDGKHVRVEEATYKRVQRGQPELMPDMWAALYGKEQGVDLEFASGYGDATLLKW